MAAARRFEDTGWTVAVVLTPLLLLGAYAWVKSRERSALGALRRAGIRGGQPFPFSTGGGQPFPFGTNGRRGTGDCGCGGQQQLMMG